jgi:calcipressin-2
MARYNRHSPYLTQETPLTIAKQYLELPVLQRNWLISPPGSPVVGWEQVEEDPPNAATLHEEIQSALDRLAAQLGQVQGTEEMSSGFGGKVILDTTDIGGVQVIVHDVDAEAAEMAKGIIPTIGKTPRPPTEDD